MCRTSSVLTACALVIFANTLGANHAFAASSAASVNIDWSSLDIAIYGDGGLVSLDEPIVLNTAIVSDAYENPLASVERVFAPALADHPWLYGTAAIAGFEAHASSAAASANNANAYAVSAANLSFAAYGSSTAFVTVAYGAIIEIGGELAEFAVASASAGLGVTQFNTVDGSEQEITVDAIELVRIGSAGTSADSGYLTALFDFAADENVVYRFDAYAAAFAGTELVQPGIVATPLPAALPLMIAALGFVSRRQRLRPEPA